MIEKGSARFQRIEHTHLIYLDQNIIHQIGAHIDILHTCYRFADRARARELRDYALIRIVHTDLLKVITIVDSRAINQIKEIIEAMNIASTKAKAHRVQN